MSDTKFPISGLSVDSQALIDHLLEAKEGDLMTYEQLKAVIGRSVQDGRGRSSLQTARNHILRNNGRWFACVRGQGVKWANAEEAVGEGTSAVAQIRRKARRTVHKIATADYHALDREKQVKHNTLLAMFGIVGEVMKSHKIKRLTAAVEKAQNHLLPERRALDALFNGETE